jgi:hypothetical protein
MHHRYYGFAFARSLHGNAHIGVANRDVPRRQHHHPGILIAAQQRYNGRVESLSPRLTRGGTSPAISAGLFLFKQTQIAPTLWYQPTTGSARRYISSPVDFVCCSASDGAERKKTNVRAVTAARWLKSPVLA